MTTWPIVGPAFHSACVFFEEGRVLSDLHDLQGRGRGGPPAEALLGKLKRIGRSRGPLGKAAAIHPLPSMRTSSPPHPQHRVKNMYEDPTLQFMVSLRSRRFARWSVHHAVLWISVTPFAGDARHVRKMCLAYRRGHPICKNHGSEHARSFSVC